MRQQHRLVISTLAPALGVYSIPTWGGSWPYCGHQSQRSFFFSTDTDSPCNPGQITSSMTHFSYPSCHQSRRTRRTRIPLQGPDD